MMSDNVWHLGCLETRLKTPELYIETSGEEEYKRSLNSLLEWFKTFEPTEEDEKIRVERIKATYNI